MNQQILSQDEVDALLQGITGESQKLEQEDEPKEGIRDYNLANQERIVRGRMPTMEIVNERFARNIRIGLFNLIRKSPEVSVGGIKVQKYSAFLREIVVPTNFNIMAIRPLRGSGLVVCDPTLVFAVIDSLFGGAGNYHTRIEGRDFSPTEQRIITRLIEVVSEEYKKAWRGIPSSPRSPRRPRSWCAARSRWRSAMPAARSTSASLTPRWSRSATSCSRRSRGIRPSPIAAG